MSVRPSVRQNETTKVHLQTPLSKAEKKRVQGPKNPSGFDYVLQSRVFSG